MPEARALRTFNSTQFGLIRSGSVFKCPPDYLRKLEKNGLAVQVSEDPAPSKNRSHPEAPNRGGKGAPAPGSTKPDTGRTPDNGKAGTSSSAQAAPASTGKTSSASAAGVSVRRPRKGKTGA